MKLPTAFRLGLALAAIALLAGCPGTTTPVVRLPSIAGSRSDVSDGVMTVSATASAGNFEIIRVSLVKNFNHVVVGQSPHIGPGNVLQSLRTDPADFDAATGRVSNRLSDRDMQTLRQNSTVQLWYQWVITYRVRGGTDQAEANSAIFRTSLAHTNQLDVTPP